MNNFEEEYFMPGVIDEQIEHYLSQQVHPNRIPERQTVQDLQQHYAPPVHDDQQEQVLSRVWQHLVQQDASLPALSSAASETHPLPLLVIGTNQLERHTTPSVPSRNAHRRPKRVFLGQTLAAVLLMVVLVGSIALLVNAASQHAQMGTRNPQTQPTPTPTISSLTPTTIPQQRGQTLYTTPSNHVGFNALSWSPDSKRIASATIESVQIWDAINGQHLVTVGNTGGQDVSWSPTGQMVAVTTSQAVLLVEGQTGTIVGTYPFPVTSTGSPGGRSSFSTHIPASGNSGFQKVTWSPDGHLLAVSVSTGVNGSIQVLDAQTMTRVYTLQLSGNYGPTDLSWSSDGHYLAAAVFNTEPGNQSVPQDQLVMIWAWNTSTRQLVFQQSGGNGGGESLAFQPGSHKLAFFGVTPGAPTQLEMWDVASGQLVKRFPLDGSGPLAWSPDGLTMAYIPSTRSNQVVILEMKHGRPVYTYQGHQENVSQLAWSANGKYLVSGEGRTTGTTLVAKVWRAE